MGGVTNTERLLAESMVPEFREEDFKAEAFHSGNRLVMIAPTWYTNPKKNWTSYKKDFKEDFYQAAADYGARPLAHVRRYIAAPEYLKSQAKRRPHPMIGNNIFADWFQGGGKSYVLGLDLSNLVKDNAALTLMHLEAGIAYVDLFYVIPGARGEHLVFAEVRNFIGLLQKRNFSIVYASMDSWQTLSLSQDLEAMGIKTEINSCDRTTELPDIASGMIMNNRLDFYYFPLFIKEACELIKTKTGKVDHPSNGSKDCWDSFCHAVYMIKKYPSANLSFGSV